MPYAYISFSQLKTALLERLGDDGYAAAAPATFWTDLPVFSEIGAYLVESMRTWNAYAWFWRDRQSFQLTSATPFYDLTSPALPSLNPAGGLRPYTVTDQYLIGVMEYQLLEPYSVTSWTGTEMFTFDAVVRAIERRRNQFLVETGMVLTHGTQALAGASDGRLTLPDTMIDVVRGYWIDALSGTGGPVWKSDAWAANSFKVGWTITPGVPKNFDVLSTQPLVVQLIPPPANQGTFDFLAVESGPPLDPANGPTILGIPDDFTWVVKMGALADLLGQDGPAREPHRSQYCEQRWEEGCELARQFPCLLDAQLNGVAVSNILSVGQLDRQTPSWQSTPSAAQTPRILAAAGSNIVAPYPIQNGVSALSLTADMVRNAQVPVNAPDLIQLGREELDVILDYAEHLAAWKMEGTEFDDTIPHYQRMVRLAAQYNERLEASAFYLRMLAETSERQVIDVPRRSSDALLATR